MSKAAQIKAAPRPRRLGAFFSEVRVELRKVKWPSWHDLWQLTGVVFMTVIGVGVYVALLDFVFTTILRQVGMYG